MSERHTDVASWKLCKSRTTWLVDLTMKDARIHCFGAWICLLPVTSLLASLMFGFLWSSELATTYIYLLSSFQIFGIPVCYCLLPHALCFHEFILSLCLYCSFWEGFRMEKHKFICLIPHFNGNSCHLSFLGCFEL